MIFYRDDSLDANFWFAAEEILSETCDEPVFLLWSTEPTVMIGQFQNILSEIDRDYIEKNGIVLTRRRSGGGAIYTDRGTFQYTYWIPGKSHAESGFAECSAPVLAALRDMGLDASFSGRNDIVVNGVKISGTARYVTDKGIVHHGSLLFDADKDKMAGALTPDTEKLTAKGIKSVRSRIVNIKDLLGYEMTADEFYNRIVEKNAEIRTFSDEQKRLILNRKKRWDDWAWIYGENPKFERNKSARYAGGRIKSYVTVTHGVLENLKLEGDFFAVGDVGQFCQTLCGCRYDADDFMRRLVESGIDGDRLIRGMTQKEIFDVIL